MKVSSSSKLSINFNAWLNSANACLITVYSTNKLTTARPTYYGHCFYLPRWRRDRYFLVLWTFEFRLAVCRAKAEPPSFLSFFLSSSFFLPPSFLKTENWSRILDRSSTIWVDSCEVKPAFSQADTNGTHYINNNNQPGPQRGNPWDEVKQQQL